MRELQVHGEKKKKIQPAIPEEMEAKRNASGCRFGATGSYGDESSMSPPEKTAKTKIHLHLCTSTPRHSSAV